MTLATVCLLLLGIWGHSVESAFANGRVVGGSTAPDRAYPYQISIRLQDWGHICGGSIINDGHVLTAAHCVSGENVKDMTVVAGTNRLIDSQQTNYTVREAIIHEDFQLFLMNDDIAILKLNEKIIFNDRIQPVGLTEVYPPPGTNCTLTGWGSTVYPWTEFPDQLQHIRLKTISLEECKRKLPLNALPVGQEQICTLTKTGEGACGGDSGGPLVDNASGGQIGVISWGYSCALGWPDIYTNVYAYRGWIGERSGGEAVESTTRNAPF
ncbi:chymotrypsin-1-like [Photinus pyralis]|uniref:chymotrypsin-1-like n=1 Tax=Photinus pyralis TaxID=7054 RepID=UPI00126743F7|nr:chymotrypsin-1-like [Photinus pyralis]